MHRITGLTKLYYAYLDYLREESVRSRLLPLQMAGKMEDYLTKEFASFVWNASEGTRFAISNSGNRGEPKIDIAIIKSGNDKYEYIAESLVEAKYFRNRHRLALKEEALDEHAASFKELNQQLSFEPKETHGYHGVNLRAKTTKIYGLVFASYTRLESDDDRKEEYYRNFLTRACSKNVRYHDLKKPYLRSIYEDEEIKILGQHWLVTLRGGLWRPLAG